MNGIKHFFHNMICSRYGNVNSKIFVGLLSFVVSSVALFIPAVPHDKLLIYIIFCASCFGMSCYDNKTSFKFTKNDTTSETVTTTKNTDVKVDAAEIVKNFKGKKKTNGKQR